MFHKGNRQLQDAFGSRALADRLVERLKRTAFTADDAEFIAAQSFFFLATADAEGRPDCSFKGGAPGFVQVLAPDLLVFPDYDGNGMFKSLGNIVANPQVGMLFITMGEKPQRLRVNGRAEVVADHPMMAAMPGAQLIVRVTPEAIFPNCPRYIPDLVTGTPSKFAPLPETPPLEPSWKAFPDFADVVPPRRA